MNKLTFILLHVIIHVDIEFSVHYVSMQYIRYASDQKIGEGNKSWGQVPKGSKQDSQNWIRSPMPEGGTLVI